MMIIVRTVLVCRQQKCIKVRFKSSILVIADCLVIVNTIWDNIPNFHSSVIETISKAITRSLTLHLMLVTSLLSEIATGVIVNLTSLGLMTVK